MKKFIGLLALVALLAGCQNTPQPTLNLYAPYGSPRVQPPATGAYGSPNTYYPQTNAPQPLGAQGAASPIRAASTRAASAVAKKQTTTAGGEQLHWRAIGSAAPVSDGTSNNDTAPPAAAKPSSRVALAAFTKKIPGNADANRSNGENGDVVNIVEQVVPSGTKLELKGMPLNDLTAPVATRAPQIVTARGPLPAARPPSAIVSAPAATPVRSITVSAIPANARRSATPQSNTIEIGQMPMPRLRLRGLTPALQNGATPITPTATPPASGTGAEQTDAVSEEPAAPSSSPPGKLIPAATALPMKSVLRDNRSLATRLDTPSNALDWKGR